MGERRIVLSSVSCSLFYGQHTGFITVITVFYFSLVFHFFFVFMQVGCKKDFFVCHFSGNFFLSIVDGSCMLLLASNGQILMRYLRSPNGEPATCRENIE